MGQEIVYCVRCANRLAGADFDRGNAFRAAGKVVCAACLPLILPNLTVEEQNAVVSLSSTKMRAVKHSPAPGAQGSSVRLMPARPEPSAPKSNLGLIVAGTVGGLAVLIAIGVLATRPGPAPREPLPPQAPAAKPLVAPPVEKREEPPLREAREAIESARALARTAPENLDAQLAAWEEAARKAALTPFFKDASAGLQEIRDKRAALKPPPPRPPETPVVAAPVEPAIKPPSPEAKAYLLRWEAAMAKASSRDFEGAVADLTRAAVELGDEAVKREARADADQIQRVRTLMIEAQAALSRLSRGQSVSLHYRSETGERKRVDGSVVRAGTGRAEIRQGDATVFIEAEDVAAGSLAALYDARSEADRLAFAILCLLEGDVEAAERLAGPLAGARYANVARDAAAKIPKPSPREIEARNRFYAAEREFSKTETLPAAVAKYKSLAEDYSDTRVVKGESLRIHKRAEAGRDYVFVAGALKGTGTFGLGPAPRTDVAWISKANVEGNRETLENFVEVEFAALPETAYRCWALVGGCCAETLVFFLQTTEGMENHPRTKQKTSIDPGAELASVVKHSITGLKKTHEEHKIKGSKTHPKTAARWEWVSIPLPKYSAAGAKKVRLMSDQQGFGVGAIVVSAARTATMPDAELKEEVARIRSTYAAAQEGLVGWWRLDEPAGSLASDAVEGGHAGALRGSPKWSGGKVGGALKFDAGDEIEIDGSYSFSMITVSAWVKHDGFASPRQRYVTVGDEAAVIRCEGDRGVHFYIRTNGQLRQILVPAVLEPGKWSHIAGTWDGLTQKIYKDGVLIGSATPGGKLNGEATRVRIGSTGESMRGTIDEVRLYHRALSEAELQKQFAEGTAGTIPEIGAAPPPPPAKPWRPLFDGASLQCLRNNGGRGWKYENGVIAMIPDISDAGQTREVIEDGELRVKFEVKDVTRIWFKLRQGTGGGYMVEFEGAAARALEGKPHEVVFTAKGEEVTATFDGKPVAVQQNGPAKQGCLQFNGYGKTFNLLSIEVR